MKIALVSSGFSLTRGGAEQVAVNLSRALEGAGHTVHVYSERDDEAGSFKPSGFTRVPSGGFFTTFRAYNFHRNVRRLLAQDDYDAVFGLCRFFPLDIYRASQGVHLHSMRLRTPNRFFRALKYLVSPKHLTLLWLEKRLMEPGNHRFIITNSKLVKGHIVKYFGVSEDSVRVVYNGVDHERFNPGVKRHRSSVREELGIPVDGIVALFVANNWKLKGLGTVLGAVGANEGMRLIVAGRGRKEGFLKAISRLGIPTGSVVFTGPVEKVERLYGAADFFVLPTQYEPCSNVCLEAMASALPVVTTRSNGASEFIAHGENGFILDEWSDDRGLSEVFRKLKDKDTREALGKKASDTIAGFTWARTMEETVGVMEETLRVLDEVVRTPGSRADRDPRTDREPRKQID